VVIWEGSETVRICWNSSTSNGRNFGSNRRPHGGAARYQGRGGRCHPLHGDRMTASEVNCHPLAHALADLLNAGAGAPASAPGRSTPSRTKMRTTSPSWT
jgi:hypothetical protein